MEMELGGIGKLMGLGFELLFLQGRSGCEDLLGIDCCVSGEDCTKEFP